MQRRAFLTGAGLLVGVHGGRSSAELRQSWPGGARAAVSLTFDDGLDSQLDVALPLLDARRQRATFFVTGEQLARRTADWRAVAARGHELANHSATHPCDLQRFAPRDFIRREIAPVARQLTALGVPSGGRVYAYPCDVTDLGPGAPNRQAVRYAALLARAGIVAARTSEGAPNNPRRARRQPHRLQALAVGYDAPGVATVLAYLDTALARGHWAILVFHEVCAVPRDVGDTAVRDFAAILDGIAARPLWSAPMGEVFARLRG